MRRGVRVATWDEVLRYGGSGCRKRGLLPRMAGGAGFSFVRASSNNTIASGNPITATWASAPTQGDLLVAGAYGEAAETLTMSSSGWTALTSLNDAGSSQGCRMFWKIAGAAESTSVSVTNASASRAAVACAEYTPPAGTVLATDVSPQANASSATQTTPSTTPPTGAQAVVVCFLADQVNAAWGSNQVNSSAVGVNARTNTQNGSIAAEIFDLLVTSTAGSYSGSGQAGTSIGVGAIAVFYVLPATPAPPYIIGGRNTYF